MKISFFLAAFFLMLFASSCKKSEVENTSVTGLQYYPLSTGKFVVYDVDSTVYTEFPRDTFQYKYRIKEKIADSFTDNTGKLAYRLERYIKKFNPNKNYDSIPWLIKEVWMVNGDNQKIQVLSGNVRYTKLIFPVAEHASWDGNANNNQGKKIYSYEFIDKSASFNGQALQQVLKVAEETYTTQISYNIEAEQYAKDIGLVHHQFTRLLSATVIANVPILDRITSGITFTQTLNTYGYE